VSDIVPKTVLLGKFQTRWAAERQHILHSNLDYKKGACIFTQPGPTAVSRGHAGVGCMLTHQSKERLSFMSESLRTIVKCQDPGDGSGDVIIDLPPDVLVALNVGVGDSLSIELINGSVVLKPVRDTDKRS
jgi:hypothetical protein